MDNRDLSGTDIGLLKISESVRVYAYLILNSQASARSSIIGNSASSLTAQSAFLNNFENTVNHGVDICKAVKRYRDTLSYASSKVDYSVRENLFMLPTNLELRIRPGTVRYNNKILVSDGTFSLGKNEKVNVGSANSLEVPVIKNHKGSNVVTQTAVTHKGSNIVIQTAVTHKGSNVVTQTAVTHKDSETAVTYKDLEKSRLLPMKKRKLL